MLNSFSVATAKGLRPYQEDFYFRAETEYGRIMGVFDGHGGSECSLLASQKFPEILLNKISAGEGVPAALKETFSQLNSMTAHMRAGTTASVAVFAGDQVYVAVLGDSPVVVKTTNGIWVAPEHNIRSNPVEADAAIARGGQIYEGYLYASGSSGLQMGRALGDANLSSVLNRNPEIFSHTIGKDSFVLVCTDGAIDPAHSNSDSGKTLVKLVESGMTAQGIVNRALGIPTHDNVTVLLVKK